jgi:hypothetical protein
MGAMGSFGWDRQDTAGRGRVLGMVVGGVGEQRKHGRKAGVAGGGAVAAFGVEVSQKASDQVGVELGEVEGRRGGAGCLGGVAQQQPPT